MSKGIGGLKAAILEGLHLEWMVTLSWPRRQSPVSSNPAPLYSGSSSSRTHLEQNCPQLVGGPQTRPPHTP